MIDVVMITTDRRWQLFHQSVKSLFENSSSLSAFELTIVHDNDDSDTNDNVTPAWNATEIFNRKVRGASASRNIGASSIPKYRRGKYVLFLDDDVYMCPKWDERLMELARHRSMDIISGYSHPFNHAEPIAEHETTSMRNPDWKTFSYGRPLVISSVAMMMRWDLWDDVGFWTEPGGAGASEDYDYCMRAKAKGCGFAVTEPQCILHCGLTSSNGNKIVGYQESVELNERLVREHGLRGVVWQ